MREKIFVAGATGAIGRRLLPLLVGDGWEVLSMTRSIERAKLLQAAGVDTVVVDAFDSVALGVAMAAFRPDVVMHQLTDLPRDLSKLDGAALARNAKLRRLGTRNLLNAAEACRAKRFIAQSIAFDYADGQRPHTEADLMAGHLSDSSDSSQGVTSLEDQVIQAGIPAVILRYGRFYGPGTGSERPWGPASVHIDAAAHAARLAAESPHCGIFNIVEDDSEVDSSKAQIELGWHQDWRPVA